MCGIGAGEQMKEIVVSENVHFRKEQNPANNDRHQTQLSR